MCSFHGCYHGGYTQALRAHGRCIGDNLPGIRVQWSDLTTYDQSVLGILKCEAVFEFCWGSLSQSIFLLSYCGVTDLLLRVQPRCEPSLALKVDCTDQQYWQLSVEPSTTDSTVTLQWQYLCTLTPPPLTNIQYTHRTTRPHLLHHLQCLQHWQDSQNREENTHM